MERMSHILAKTAHQRARRTSPADDAATAPGMPATPASAKPSPRPAARADQPGAVTPRHAAAGMRHPTPAPHPTAVLRAAMPGAPGASDPAHAGPARPGPAPVRPRPADIAAPTVVPIAADALEYDRILELPPRAAGPAREPVSRAPAQLAADRSHAEGMAALREVATPYLAQMAARRKAADATPVGEPPSAANMSIAPADRVRGAGVCPICHGAGYVRLDVPIGDPSFGQAVPCRCKERQREERRRSDLDQLSSLQPFRGKTFETFDARVAGTAEAFAQARHFAEEMDGWLVLRGGYGVGKTHLAAAIANYQLALGTPVFFSVVPDLLDHLRAAFAPASEVTYDALFDRIREVELLVLDDLGAENGTAWATEKLFQLINYRYNFRMPTVFTTNHRLLSHLDERIRSRLADLSLVRQALLETQDYRERHVGRAPRAGRTASGPANTGSSGARQGQRQHE